MMPKLDPHPSTEPLKDTQFVEKRRHRRIQLSIRCWIIDGNHTLYLRVYDLSLGGLSVRTPAPFQPDRELRILIELPDRTQVRARGQVVWIRPSAGVESRPRMGVRFVEFTEGEQALHDLLGDIA
jgi:Tfp pilus assembly protein PilZ